MIPRLDEELGVVLEFERDAAADIDPEVPAAARAEHRFNRIRTADVPVRIADDAVADVPA